MFVIIGGVSLIGIIYEGGMTPPLKYPQVQISQRSIKPPGWINKLQEGRRVSHGYLCNYVSVISNQYNGKCHESISRETVDHYVIYFFTIKMYEYSF